MTPPTASSQPGPDALVAQATAAMDAGRLPEARSQLLAAATQFQAASRPVDERWCLQLAATLTRLLGDPAAARPLAERAAALAEPGSAAAVSAAAELGEIALALRDPATAATCFREALDHAAGLHLAPPEETGLRRKLAGALATTGRAADAVAELRQARARLAASGDPANALRTLVEAATAAQDGRLGAEADTLRAEAFQMAQAANDQAALADLELLNSAAALDRHEPEAALAAAQRARDHALGANTPVSYVAATTAIAQLCERCGDRLGAYAALAAGYVTLGDLLDPESGRATFAPKLADLRQRWGAVGFSEIKAAYEAGRRANHGAQTETVAAEATRRKNRGPAAR